MFLPENGEVGFSHTDAAVLDARGLANAVEVEPQRRFGMRKAEVLGK